VLVAADPVPAQTDDARDLLLSKEGDEALEFRPLNFISNTTVSIDFERRRLESRMSLPNDPVIAEVRHGHAVDDEIVCRGVTKALSNLVID
jgi:hypothetical protein